MAFVNLQISNNISAFTSEKRFPKDLKISELKCKLELMTGCDFKHMTLELFDSAGKSICPVDNDDAMLGAYPVDDGVRLHVTDSQKKAGLFDEDQTPEVSYDISYEEYAKKSDSVLAFKKRNKLGQFREVSEEEKEQQRQKEAEEKEREWQRLETMKVGDRCEVRVAKQAPRRGTIKFIGSTKFKEGIWVGLQYDEPLGKHNGTVGDVSYFECPDKYGAFVKPLSVEVGDFPEFGLDDMDEL